MLKLRDIKRAWGRGYLLEHDGSKVVNATLWFLSKDHGGKVDEVDSNKEQRASS